MPIITSTGKMKWAFVAVLCVLALCSGRPQGECSADGYCEQTLPPEPDVTTTSAPETTTEDDGDMKGGDDGDANAESFAKGLARQGEGALRAPRPRPIPRPSPTPRPIPDPSGPTPPRERVAFSVRKATTLSAPTRVEFQDVLSNVGGGWSQRRSEFQAPYRGGYYFSFHAVAEGGGEFTMALMKNGVYQVTAYGALGEYELGSNSAFLELGRGERVYLQLQDGSIYEHPSGEAYTSFTGFLVFRH